jgi:hypothetical protein
MRMSALWILILAASPLLGIVGATLLLMIVGLVRPASRSWVNTCLGYLLDLARVVRGKAGR